MGEAITPSIINVPVLASSDCSPSIQNAINAASRNGGGVVSLSASVYAVNQTITVPAGVIIIGQGADVTVITPQSDYGDVFVFPAAANAAQIKDLKVNFTGITASSLNTPSTHAAIKFTIATADREFTNDVDIARVNVVGMGQAVVMPWDSAKSVKYAQYYYATFRKMHIESCNFGIFGNGFSDCTFDDIHCENMFGMNPANINANIAPIASTAVASPTRTSTAQNLLNDLGNSVINKFEVYGGLGDGLVLQDCIAPTLFASTTASTSTNGLCIAGCSDTTRIIAHRSALNSGHGVSVETTSNSVYDVEFLGCRLEGNKWAGVHGVPGNGMNIQRVSFTDCDVVNNSQSGAGNYNGIDLQASYVNVKGGSACDTQAQPTQSYGVFANYAGADYWTLDGVKMDGNKTGPDNIAGNHVRARGCYGLNYKGFGTYQPGIPAIGAANKVTNTAANRVKVYLSGQAGTHIIDESGTDTALPAESNIVTLNHGESIYFATTAPATWKWYGE